MSADSYPSIFILKDIPIFFLQVSLQAIALDKINETSALFSMKPLDVEACNNCNDFYRIDAVVSMFKDSSVSGTKEVKHH